MASVLSNAPSLVALSRHKPWVFAISGLMIAGNSYYVYRLAPRLQARALACSIDDPRCRIVGRFSQSVLWISAAIWLVGFAVAFALGPILSRFD